MKLIVVSILLILFAGCSGEHKSSTNKHISYKVSPNFEIIINNLSEEYIYPVHIPIAAWRRDDIGETHCYDLQMESPTYDKADILLNKGETVLFFYLKTKEFYKVNNVIQAIETGLIHQGKKLVDAECWLNRKEKVRCYNIY